MQNTYKVTSRFGGTVPQYDYLKNISSPESEKFINTLYHNIKTRGAMDTIITDGGKNEIRKKVADLLRSLIIKQYESEPYHQHQNKAEQHYGVVKRYINTLVNLTGAPAHCWLLCLVYVCSHSNVTASPTLDGITPLQAHTRQIPDISHFLQFSSGNLFTTR